MELRPSWAGQDNLLADIVHYYLKLNNEHPSKAEVARQKILQYVETGDVKVQEFVGMKLKMIPSAVAWIGRDGTGFQLMHQLVKSMPSLFESNANVVGTKRKRDL